MPGYTYAYAWLSYFHEENYKQTTPKFNLHMSEKLQSIIKQTSIL